MWGWWGWWSCLSEACMWCWVDWWWNWSYCDCHWCPWTMWWWWGGSWFSTGCKWWRWWDGAVKICYKSDWTCWITSACGWTVTTSWWYCIHTFTCDWAFYIPGAAAWWCWIYHSAEKWLITMSCGDWRWITIKDKNLWATTTDISSTDSYWCYYQWWNNYWFPQSWFTTSTTCANTNRCCASTYCNCTFIKTSNNCDWSTKVNDNLRWDTSNTRYARRWPWPDWFHVPSFADKCRMVLTMKCILWRDLTTQDTVDYLYMPKSWYIWYNNATATCVWTSWYWRLSSYYAAWSYPNGLSYNTATANCSSASNYNRRATWYPIRPFKDMPEIPDETWCKLV